MDDALDVLAWRNDPLSVAMSKSPGTVEQSNHIAWFARAVRDPQRLLLIATDGNRKLGMVRFDKQAEIWAVSINLAPAERGRGFAFRILGDAIALFRALNGPSNLLAEIKADNDRSQRLFERYGFSLVAEFDGFRSYELALE